MDIGTAKPSPALRSRVPYHLVDLVDPSEEFTVQQFQHEARRVRADIAARGNGTLLVGGTGLYLRSVVDDLTFPGRYPQVSERLERQVAAAGPPDNVVGQRVLVDLHERLVRLDPVAAARIEPTNRRRLLRALEVTEGSGRPFSSFGPGLERYPETPVSLFGLRIDLAVLDEQIAGRFEQWMADGLLEEVRELAARPGGLSRTARQALGYRELLDHLEGGVPLTSAVASAIQRTRTFARRQLAWFRRDPRIVWLDPADDPVGRIAAVFQGYRKPQPAVRDWRPAS
jgi:tRNA dimethylallyltransferase